MRMESSDKKEKKVSEEMQPGSNYKVMETYENLDKPGQTAEKEGDQRSKITGMVWIRSDKFFWTFMPFSNSKCAKERHSADISLNL